MKRAAAVAALAFLCGCAAPAPVTHAEARGLFVGKGDPDAVLKARDLDFVAGLVANHTWAELQPAPDRFDWSALDAEFAWANASGKTLFLVMKAGEDTPAWVFKTGVSFIDYTELDTPYIPLRMPVPWDSKFLEAWTAFLKTLGARYASEPRLAIVQVGGLAQNRGSMHLPAGPGDDAKLKAAGYSVEKWLGAWKQVIAATADAFPDVRIRIALSRNITSPEVASGAADALVERCPKRADVVIAHVIPGWTGHAPDHAEIVDLIRRRHERHATWGAELAGRGITDLDAAFAAAAILDARYVEVRAETLLDETQQPVLRKRASMK